MSTARPLYSGLQNIQHKSGIESTQNFEAGSFRFELRWRHHTNCSRIKKLGRLDRIPIRIGITHWTNEQLQFSRRHFNAIEFTYCFHSLFFGTISSSGNSLQLRIDNNVQHTTFACNYKID